MMGDPGLLKTSAELISQLTLDRGIRCEWGDESSKGLQALTLPVLEALTVSGCLDSVIRLMEAVQAPALRSFDVACSNHEWSSREEEHAYLCRLGPTIRACLRDVDRPELTA